MIESGIKRIEDSSELKLPPDYRHLLLYFPVRFSVGTIDQPLWGDAAALLSRNQELRVDRKSLGVQYRQISDNYFLIGEDGGGWQFLIDLYENPPLFTFTMDKRSNSTSEILVR